MLKEMNRRKFNKILGGSTFLLAASKNAGTQAKKKIKIGQIGTSHAHAAGKMRTLRKLDDLYEVVGIVENDDRQEAIARKQQVYQDIPWMTEAQLLNMEDLDAVAVETAVTDLVPTALRCIEAGVHVHLDKPAGETLSTFRKLLDMAYRKNLEVQMGYMFRYNPAFQLCYKAVREGWLGDIFELHGVISKKIDADRRRELAKYEGGSMFELGCHLIDSMVYVLGKPIKVTPYMRRTNPQDNLTDNQLAVCEYSVATTSIRSTLVEPFGVKRRQFVVCGTEGTVEIRPLEPPKLLLALTKPKGEYEKGYQEVELEPMEGRYHGDFIDLAKIIRNEKEPDFSPQHNLNVQETVLRASGLPVI